MFVCKSPSGRDPISFFPCIGFIWLVRMHRFEHRLHMHIINCLHIIYLYTVHQLAVYQLFAYLSLLRSYSRVRHFFGCDKLLLVEDCIFLRLQIEFMVVLCDHPLSFLLFFLAKLSLPVLIQEKERWRMAGWLCIIHFSPQSTNVWKQKTFSDAMCLCRDYPAKYFIPFRCK